MTAEAGALSVDSAPAGVVQAAQQKQGDLGVGRVGHLQVLGQVEFTEVRHVVDSDGGAGAESVLLPGNLLDRGVLHRLDQLTAAAGQGEHGVLVVDGRLRVQKTDVVGELLLHRGIVLVMHPELGELVLVSRVKGATQLSSLE